MIKKNFWNFIFVLSIFFSDRLSKISIIKFSDTYTQSEIKLTPFLNLSLIWNEGIAFGLLSFDQEIYYNILTLIIILITIIIFWMITKTEKFEKAAFIMIFGGSLGNIFDRIYYSAVPDFIDIHIKNFHWFIFNVADIFICLGIIILITLEFYPKKKI